MCAAPNGVPCDDGNACTDDVCVAGVCENTPRIGIASLTCTCDQPLPDACVGVTLPKSLHRFTTRACRLFNAAVDAKPKKQRRRLRQASRALLKASSIVVHAQIRGLRPECAAVLSKQFLSTGAQAVTLANHT